MKILHIVEDFSLKSGGLRTVINNLNTYLNQTEHSSYVLSSKKEDADSIFVQETNMPWLYSKGWIIQINNLQNKFNFDVFHIHGVWTYPQYLSAKFCKENKIPFIVSAHGMYEPWLWEKGAAKKKIYFNMLTKKLFGKANFIHAITPGEKTNLIQLFNKKEVIEIPNLISESSTLPDIFINNEKKYILYLGRLDKKKGIDLLIKSFSKIGSKKITLKIAGQINEYKKELDYLIEKLEINRKVEFLGMVSGIKKEELIRNAFVLVAPSHSEVIGMVNLEAAILKTPVITTYQTGLNPLWNENGGILINPVELELDNALQSVLNWSNEDRIIKGDKLHKFVVNKYSWEKRFKDWLNLYKSCVYEN
jgi:glycosyltransferase involved in cell wall biosynthesis